MTKRELFIQRFYDDTQMYISPDGICIQENDLLVFSSQEKSLFPAIVSKRITKTFGTIVPDGMNRFPERNAFVCYKGDNANDDHIIKIRGEEQSDYLMHDYLITTNTMCWELRYFIERKTGILSSVTLSNYRSSLHFDVDDSDIMSVCIEGSPSANPEDDEKYFLNPLHEIEQEAFETARLDWLERVTNISFMDIFEKTKIAQIQDAMADTLDSLSNGGNARFSVSTETKKDVIYNQDGNFDYSTSKHILRLCNTERCLDYAFKCDTRYAAEKASKIIAATLIQITQHKTLFSLQNPFKSDQLNRTFRKVKWSASNPTDNGLIGDDYVIVFNGEVHKYDNYGDAANDMSLWRVLFGYKLDMNN